MRSSSALVLCYLAQPGVCESVWWYRAGAPAEVRSPGTWPVGGACWRQNTHTPSSSRTSSGHSLRSACSWCPDRWCGSTCARHKENLLKTSLSELSLNSQWQGRIGFCDRQTARISQCFVCFSFQRDLTTGQTVPGYVGLRAPHKICCGWTVLNCWWIILFNVKADDSTHLKMIQTKMEHHVIVIWIDKHWIL